MPSRALSTCFVVVICDLPALVIAPCPSQIIPTLLSHTLGALAMALCGLLWTICEKHRGSETLSVAGNDYYDRSYVPSLGTIHPIADRRRFLD